MNLRSIRTHKTTQPLHTLIACGVCLFAFFSIRASYAVDKIPGYSTKDAVGGDGFVLFIDGSIGARVRKYDHASTASIPRSHGVSLQGRAGLRLWDTLVLGVAPEYQFLQQFDKNGAFVGNWSGYELSLIKPILGLHFNAFQVLFGYSLSPELNLSSKTSTGQTLSYTNGTAYQAEVDFNSGESEYITLHYSFGSYQDQILDGVTTPLSASVKWSAFGIGYTRNFF